MEYKEGKGTNSIQIAIAAKKFGMNVIYFTTYLGYRKEYYNDSYYIKFAEFEKIDYFIEEAKKLKVEIEIKSLNTGFS